jgi:hypothetical protein
MTIKLASVLFKKYGKYAKTYRLYSSLRPFLLDFEFSITLRISSQKELAYC